MELDPVRANDWLLATLVALLITLTILKIHFGTYIELLDIPSERSHPSWTSSSNLCQKLLPIRTTLA